MTKATAGGGRYFASASERPHDFISTGCTLLDCALGGGYPLGRVSNIVGDKSTGKTLLAIEAVGNFLRKYPDGLVWYNETEAAFDKAYAQALGMPLDQIIFVRDTEPCYTVEEWAKHLETAAKRCRGEDRPGFYVLDSLDALSDDAEKKREIGDASYGASKAKAMSELFRRINQDVESARLHLMVISQVRDNIGVTFGKKYSRSGGRALDFYATHVVYLAHIGRISKERKKIKRVIGVEIMAMVEKNKVALPFRQCVFSILFGYGIDDLTACLSWLDDLKRIDESGVDDADKLLKAPLEIDNDTYARAAPVVAAATRRVWDEIEAEFLPKRSKAPVSEPSDEPARSKRVRS